MLSRFVPAAVFSMPDSPFNSLCPQSELLSVPPAQHAFDAMANCWKGKKQKSVTQITLDLFTCKKIFRSSTGSALLVKCTCKHKQINASLSRATVRPQINPPRRPKAAIRGPLSDRQAQPQP